MKILPSGFWSTNSEPIIMEMMDEGYYALWVECNFLCVD
jgi:hypothetical protein